MVRNYLIFGDATRGLGLPIPMNMATLLGLATPSAVGLDAAKVTTANSLAVLPLGTLVEMYNELTNIYGMQLFLIFISFSIVAYICFSSLRNILSRKNILFILAWVLIYGILIVRIATYKDSGLAPQFFVLFGVPLLGYIYIRFFSGHKDVFTTGKNNIYAILAIFGIISFTSYFLYGIKSGRIDVEPRLILYTLYLFIPLAIIGIKKILQIVFIPLNMPRRRKTVTLSLVCILIIFSFVQVSTGLPAINQFQEIRAEKDFQKSMHDWIKRNVPLNAKIGSDFPHVVLLRTGHEAVNFAQAYKDNPSYERWIINKFDLDYLVFYYPKNRQTVNLTITDLGDMQLTLVYRSGLGSIYKITS
jgi:hypothetical protein